MSMLAERLRCSWTKQTAVKHVTYNIARDKLKAQAPAHSLNRCTSQYILPTPTKWPETVSERGMEVMKNVSFLRPCDTCLINDKWEKKGRKLSFHSHFFTLQREMQECCRHTTQLGAGVGERANTESRIDQGEGWRRNTVHTLTYCFLTSSCARAREPAQREAAGVFQEKAN